VEVLADCCDVVCFQEVSATWAARMVAMLPAGLTPQHGPGETRRLKRSAQGLAKLPPLRSTGSARRPRVAWPSPCCEGGSTWRTLQGSNSHANAHSPSPISPCPHPLVPSRPSPPRPCPPLPTHPSPWPRSYSPTWARFAETSVALGKALPGCLWTAWFSPAAWQALAWGSQPWNSARAA
jgi:hypothetical protein